MTTTMLGTQPTSNSLQMEIHQCQLFHTVIQPLSVLMQHLVDRIYTMEEFANMISNARVKAASLDTAEASKWVTPVSLTRIVM